MNTTLQPGQTSTFSFQVPENKTVPFLLPEAEEFQLMPKVLATGFMVGLMEWACIRFINEHINWPVEQSVGTGISVSHVAATPPGLTITIQLKLDSVEGRKLTFSLQAHDGIDLISEGTHERFIIVADKFNSNVDKKRKKTVNAHSYEILLEVRVRSAPKQKD